MRPAMPSPPPVHHPNFYGDTPFPPDPAVDAHLAGGPLADQDPIRTQTYEAVVAARLNKNKKLMKKFSSMRR